MAQALELAARGAEHPLPDGDDEPRLLGEGKEFVGRHQAPLRMGPAQKRLEPLDAARLHFDDGQVEKAELLAQERAAQVRLELHELGLALAHRGVEHHRARPALRLGAVHGGVGIPEQLLRLLVGRGAERDADAHRAEDLVTADLERLAGHLVDAIGHHRGVLRRLHVVEQDGELVAAVAGEGVALAQAGLEALAHLDEKLVADLVPEAVVDRLEAIEVHEEDGEAVPLAPSRPRERALDEIVEERPVGQLGERIVERVVQHALLLLPLLRDVCEDAAHPHRPPLRIALGLAPDQHPAPAAVRLTQPVLVVEALRLTREVSIERGLQRLAIVGVHAIEPCRRSASRCLASDQIAKAIGDPEPPPGHVPFERRIARRIHRAGEPIRRRFLEKQREARGCPGAAA